MRPKKLELSGFASFREHTEVDFADAELFVLFGPTGAGKSAILDAIVFALYGSIPRYENKALVAPAISKGKTEARVSLTFDLGGIEHVVTRVVRLTGENTATTKEARLEVGETVLASSAGEVTAEVERRLGLPFEHFTRCVVLPQGDFAQFLKSKPSERQDLLKRLLDLGIYEHIGSLARERKSNAANRQSAQVQLLDGPLGEVTEDAVAAAQTTAAALVSLREEAVAQGPRLQELREEYVVLERDRVAAQGVLEQLSTLTAPPEVATVGKQLREAAERVEAAAAEVAKATTYAGEAEQARAALPERALIDNQLKRVAELGQHRERMQGAHEHTAKLAEQAKASSEAHASAVAALESAAQRVSHLEREHAAAQIARHLHKGDSCPVCTQTIPATIKASVPGDLAVAEKAVSAARTASEKTERVWRAADRESAAAAATLEELQNRIAVLENEVRDVGDVATLTAQLDQIRAADEAQAKARNEVHTAQAGLDRAQAAAAELDGARASAMTKLHDARASFHALSPPAIETDDLTDAWGYLTNWARTEAPKQAERVGALASTIDQIRAEGSAIREALTERATGLGLEITGTDLEGQIGHAAARAENTAATMAERLSQATQARKELEQAKHEVRIADALGNHLKANKFQAWLLGKALRGLVVGASTVLQDLSAGAYTLELDERNNFLVVDHNNAGELRSAKTLSGGETFLASLSLALALSDHVAQLASKGSARLEALFLDEGFGTLDTETLDTVAVALDELGQRRMVGIVTHVRELADQIPVRFSVKKTSSNSTVERIDS